MTEQRLRGNHRSLGNGKWLLEIADCCLVKIGFTKLAAHAKKNLPVIAFVTCRFALVDSSLSANTCQILVH